MAQTINGIGTSICPARGITKPPGAESPEYDAVVCFVFFYLPLIPLRPIHAHSWRGNRYVEVPLKWSAEMVFWSFARRWAIGLLIVGIFFGLMASIELSSHGQAMGAVVGTLATLVPAVGLMIAFGNRDRRHRDIRALIGPHRLGSSDPATWTDEVVGQVALSMELFGTPTDSSAVPALLEKKEYAMAMYAARLTAAREDPGAGEAMTEKILRDPGARAAIEQVPRSGFWTTML